VRAVVNLGGLFWATDGWRETDFAPETTAAEIESLAQKLESLPPGLTSQPVVGGTPRA
jgi:hypothetical protein